ncbi:MULTISPECIES: hypothetical protein [unclassified Roseitalea]|uniref:hypothetical protein n=1 Tax=unclassified Roseitalea TaxID=2639107 RepID=UPI00273D82EA|nr:MULTISPECIES: hypothetical protein [unclassified Roseitalea]
MTRFLLTCAVIIAGTGAALSPLGAPAASAQERMCASHIYTTMGQSAAPRAKAREKRAKRRAIRRWVRAVEGRSMGAKGVALPVYGTDYSSFKNAQIVSFNCSGRPLTCVLRARPCRG